MSPKDISPKWKEHKPLFYLMSILFEVTLQIRWCFHASDSVSVVRDCAVVLWLRRRQGLFAIGVVYKVEIYPISHMLLVVKLLRGVVWFLADRKKLQEIRFFLWVLKATRGLYLRVLLSQTTWKHKRPRLVKLYNMYTCIMSLHEMIVLQWLHIFEPCLNQMTGNECGFETQSIQMKKLAYIIIVMSTLSTWRWLYSDISGSEFH